MRRSLATFLFTIALVFQIAAPVAHAFTVEANGSLFGQSWICSSSGQQVDGNGSGAPASSHGDDCPFCYLSHAGGMALAASAPAIAFRYSIDVRIERYFDFEPRNLVWLAPTARPRGPPAFLV